MGMKAALVNGKILPPSSRSAALRRVQQLRHEIEKTERMAAEEKTLAACAKRRMPLSYWREELRQIEAWIEEHDQADQKAIEEFWRD